MKPPALLESDALAAALQSLPGWQLAREEIDPRANALVRRFDLPNYQAGLTGVARLGALAEASDHHPDLTLVWGALTVRYATHSAGGVTALDVEAARAASEIMETAPLSP